MTSSPLYPLGLIAQDISRLRMEAQLVEIGLRQRLANANPPEAEAQLLLELVEQTNGAGFEPIRTSLNQARVVIALQASKVARSPAGREILRGFEQPMVRPSTAVRHAARRIETHCESLAYSARAMGLEELAAQLMAWAREWIRLEVNLNAALRQATQASVASAA